MSNPRYTIGGWRFDPADPVLRDGARTVPLDDRAARTLEMLCEQRGAVVSKEALVARVWKGRTVSANSVSIVIGSLRRALSDDLRSPSISSRSQATLSVQTVPMFGGYLDQT
jgi:DNA-binding winged helix-turn-helix (wHTH) protein